MDFVKGFMQKALQDLLDKIASAKGTTPTSKQMPDELRAKSTYLEGEDYTFDKDFFDLIDPNRPIRLEILNSDSGSYSSYLGDLVHIAGTKRGKASPWERKAVIYHEYGHCIDAQRDLWKDAKLTAMRNKQIKMLKKKKNTLSRNANGIMNTVVGIMSVSKRKCQWLSMSINAWNN